MNDERKAQRFCFQYRECLHRQHRRSRKVRKDFTVITVKDPIFFRSIHELFRYMERFMNELNFPQSSTELRTYEDKQQKPANEKRISFTEVSNREQILEQRGSIEHPGCICQIPSERYMAGKCLSYEKQRARRFQQRARFTQNNRKLSK